jgi:hypothetical protein
MYVSDLAGFTYLLHFHTNCICESNFELEGGEQKIRCSRIAVES